MAKAKDAAAPRTAAAAPAVKDPLAEVRKLERDALVSAVRSDLTRISSVFVAALADAGGDPARTAAAEKAYRDGLASNRAIFERGLRLLEDDQAAT